ncbi:hypothetical protein [Rhodococcus erythropolis]|uniref:DUF4760 domain-containing protein n=1 Tax=Rhodococcus erythropolis TaxID=1833 RepID=A0AAX3ZXM8_RHOER|nr:hypothetical protein [Rhodococcus erythropolis]WMN01685.1 hypothetical protein QIE55_30690 [Rhodococcus erythropolis]
MNQAQTEPVVHEVIIQSSTPWHIYIAAVIGGLIAIGGWFVVHRTSQSRDLLNWRRTALLHAVSTLIEASNNRHDTILDKSVPNSDLRKDYRKMQAAHDQIRVCASDSTLFAAAGVLSLHTTSENEIHGYANWIEGFPVIKSHNLRNFAEINGAKLSHYHNNLIREAQIDLKILKPDSVPEIEWKDDNELEESNRINRLNDQTERTTE